MSNLDYDIIIDYHISIGVRCSECGSWDNLSDDEGEPQKCGECDGEGYHE
jgi:hypothetical protein